VLDVGGRDWDRTSDPCDVNAKATAEKQEEDRSPTAHSSIPPVDRAHRGKAKIKARLIEDLDPGEWELPPKPKWMRWHTYDKHVEKFDCYEGQLDALCLRTL